MDPLPAEGPEEGLGPGARSTEPSHSQPMDQPPLVARDTGDSEVTTPAQSPLNPATADPYYAARLAKIHQHRTITFLHPNPLIASVGCCNSVLFEMQLDLETEWRQLKSHPQPSDDDRETRTELINTTMRVH